MNERTRFFIKIYLSHFILERVDVGWVWEVSWRRGQTVTYWPKVLLTIAALLSHSGWASQPWVTEGPSPLSGDGSHSPGILSPTATGTRTLELTNSSRLWHLVIWLFDIHLLSVGIRIRSEFNHVHRSRWYSDIFDWMHLSRCPSAYLHRCISWLTARSRVNILHC